MVLTDRVNMAVIAKDAQEWVSATVRVGETIDTGYSTSPLTPIVARGVQQFALICGMINVRVCSAFPIKMYRKSKSTRKRIKDRKRLEYLKSYSNGPGKSAADYARYAEDIEEVTDHPALALLRNPNPFQESDDFDEAVWLHLELSGNAFLYCDPSGPSELYLMQPQHTRIIPSVTNFIRYFAYRRESSRAIKVPPTMIGTDPWCMHYKHAPSALSPFYGASWIESVVLELDMNASATTAEWHRWERGGRPDYHIEAPATLNREQRDEYKAEFRRETQGVTKTGTFLLTSKDWKINALGFRPKDMEYPAGIEYVERRIRQAAGVSEALLNVNDANVASADAGMVQYARQTILPRLNRRARYTTKYMADLFGFKPGDYWLCYDNPVPEDERAETERCVKIISVGGMTLNEWRATEGLDPYPEDIGDVPRFNGVPLATVAQAHPAPINPDAVDAPPGGILDTTHADVAQAAQAADVQGTALNGAQVQALTAIVDQVAAGTIPLESGREIARAAFPLVPPEEIDAIFSPLIGFEPRAPEPAIAPNGASTNGSNPQQSGNRSGEVNPTGGTKVAAGDNAGAGDQGAAAKGRTTGDGAEDPPHQEPDNGRTPAGGAVRDHQRAGDGAAPGSGAGTSACAAALRRKALAFYGSAAGAKSHRKPGESVQDCVTRKIPILAGEHPDWSNEQCVAAAYSMCGGKCAPAWEAKGGPELRLTPEAEAAMNELAGKLKTWHEAALALGARQAESGQEPNFGSLQPELESIISDGLGKLSRLGWSSAAEDVGASFALKPESALAFLETYRVRLAQTITRTLAENLTDAVRAGLENGLTRVEAARAVNEVIPEESAWRADRIARTESSNAVESGKRSAYGQAGWTKEFDLSPNPCPLCEEVAAANPGAHPADYVWKGMEDNWFGGMGADVHPNCVCSVRWNPPEE